MKIILRQNIESLGAIGDMVTVRDGYARNFLLPQGLAYVATKSNVRVLDEEKKRYEVRQTKLLREAERLAAELEKPENAITISMQVGEEDRLFGSVTKDMIAEKLTEKGFDIDKRKIEIDDAIKVLGIYTINVKLQQNVTGKVKVWVVRQ